MRSQKQSRKTDQNREGKSKGNVQDLFPKRKLGFAPAYIPALCLWPDERLAGAGSLHLRVIDRIRERQSGVIVLPNLRSIDRESGHAQIVLLLRVIDVLDDDRERDAHGLEGGTAGAPERNDLLEAGPGDAWVVRFVNDHGGSALAHSQFEERVEEDLHEPEDKIAEGLMPPFEHCSEDGDYDAVRHVTAEP